MSASIMTVRGPVSLEDIGFCLPHEHVFIDLVRIHRTQLLAYDFQLIDHHLVRQEVGLFASAASVPMYTRFGRPALVELTCGPRMGRDPAALLRLSQDLDLHIVMSCGWYREPWYEPDVEYRSTTQLAEQLVDQIQHGVDGMGIKPGIIGELGTDRDYVSPSEERALRAGARAHHQTGLTITLHARGSRVALSQIEILQEERVDPSRIIVGHADSIHDPDYHEQLARIGVWVEFDTIRGKVPYAVERSVRYVTEARQRGYSAQVLLSGDVCALSHLRAYGGTGYNYLPTEFSCRLEDVGLAKEELEILFVQNPRRALAGLRPAS
jgi:predicted metal-dependent phosphotriesterase family hydrolase